MVATLLATDAVQQFVPSVEYLSLVIVPAGAVVKAFDLLDAPPRTLSAAPHRPAYGSDGDYFSKPNREQIVHVVYEMMAESSPGRFPPGAFG